MTICGVSSERLGLLEEKVCMLRHSRIYQTYQTYQSCKRYYSLFYRLCQDIQTIDIGSTKPYSPHSYPHWPRAIVWRLTCSISTLRRRPVQAFGRADSAGAIEVARN